MLSKNKKMNGYLHGGVVIFLLLNFEVHEQVGSLHNDLSPLWQVQTNTIQMRKGSMNTTHEQVVHYKMKNKENASPIN